MTSRRSPIQFAIAAFGLCALGCTLFVDSSDVDQGCGSQGKICSGKCVQKTDPAYGCTDDGCVPCQLANAIPDCNAKGECVVQACLLGFDCPDPDLKTGCLTNILADSDNCGECGNECPDGTSCSNGACVTDPK